LLTYFVTIQFLLGRQVTKFEKLLPFCKEKRSSGGLNNICICIAPYCRHFRGAGARQCASERKKRKESKSGRRGMSLV